MEQIYSFELDKDCGIVWIVFQHDRFRLNCSDRLVMTVWARFWFAKEFPTASSEEKSSFKSKFDEFLDANEPEILQLAREIGAKRIEALENLLFEIKRAIDAGRANEIRVARL